MNRALLAFRRSVLLGEQDPQDPGGPMTEKDIKFVEQHVAALAERFQNVQVLASRIKDDGSGNTEAHYHGAGDWYARQGMAHEFILMDEARTNAHVMHEEE